VLCGAADEILSVLKNDRMKDKDRKKETETLLGTVSDERFALLVNLGKKITDFNTKAVTGDESVEDSSTHGINVQFDEQSEDDDDENNFGEINDDEMDDQEGEETGDSSAIQAQNVSCQIYFQIR
jgi:pre-mRNA-splicing helicase BRR2